MGYKSTLDPFVPIIDKEFKHVPKTCFFPQLSCH